MNLGNRASQPQNFTLADLRSTTLSPKLIVTLRLLVFRLLFLQCSRDSRSMNPPKLLLNPGRSQIIDTTLGPIKSSIKWQLRRETWLLFSHWSSSYSSTRQRPRSSYDREWRENAPNGESRAPNGAFQGPATVIRTAIANPSGGTSCTTVAEAAQRSGQSGIQTRQSRTIYNVTAPVAHEAPPGGQIYSHKASL